MPLDKELLEIIVCPKCKGDLIYEEEKERLVCKNCSVYYPIREDIPILLIEEAKSLETQ
ncbi:MULTISPECIES: Trm112 family protein [Thermodesulfovibrio]|uniref:Trm112 family protein n=1 Tax=Thermodesulfovibrio TaxID=28261 RepID=UPI0003FD0AE5|nr:MULTISPECIES: Trm112 family protein [Thermodesulfovibrio]